MAAPRVVVRIGDHVVDLAAAGIAPEVTALPTLNAVMETRRGREVRERAAELLDGPERDEVVLSLDDVEVMLPFAVGDYVDFYSSIHHATNLGSILRPGLEPLLPNWRQLPVGYHGRSGTVVVSGTPMSCARTDCVADGDGAARLAPTRALDFELEVGFVVGGRSGRSHRARRRRRPRLRCRAAQRLVGARHPGFEYQPLGPYLAKSFAHEHLAVGRDPRRAAAPPRRRRRHRTRDPDPYLRARSRGRSTSQLTVDLNGTAITTTEFADMYWTFAQQLAHMTVNGATTACRATCSGRAPSADRPAANAAA